MTILALIFGFVVGALGGRFLVDILNITDPGKGLSLVVLCGAVTSAAAVAVF